ncbi:non-ribosomal peptide synthetase, partial [Niastella populi]|uniref:non-ribosomal peptide synthetase n=1 Tax=Niastella populi TaxID=550983 RepID=UPI00105488A8
LDIEYCSDLFLADTMQRFMHHYEALLASIAEEPGLHIDNINMLPAEEREIILGKKVSGNGHWFNQGWKELGNHVPMNVRFEQIAQQKATAIAVIHNDQQWTYERVNTLANQISHTLIATGITPGDCVGVYLDRDPVMISCLLGILKAGAVYIPLDTQNPPERIQKMMAGNGMKAVISNARLIKKAASIPVNRVVIVDEMDDELMLQAAAAGIHITDHSIIAAAGFDNPVNRNELHSWAYVLYTSGSTGEPKGAILQHEGAMNHILAEYQAMELHNNARLLQSAGIGSDISVWQILGPLVMGGTVVIIDKENLLDYSQLTTIIERESVNLVEFVPTYLWGLVEYIKGIDTPPALETLSWIMLTGEKIPVKLVSELKQLFPGIRLLNCYGPCEASDDVVQYEIKSIPDKDQLHVPIGVPIPNMNAFVMDKTGALCPVGVVGELGISGVGVGLGYLGMPEKTASSFIKNPFSGTLGNIIYRTGDLAKWLPDGNLVFLGRMDNQVKIRGHRVELGEIESFIRKEPDVKDCHVIIYKDDNEQECLPAFIVLQNKIKNTSIRENSIRIACSEGLPSFMQPTHFCIIDAMPINVSDKVDEHKLIKLFLDLNIGLSAQDTNYVEPRNEVEQKLVEIWKKILNVERIGVFDNFFQIGGHSLLATRVINMIRKEIEADLSIGDLFRKPVINDLAALVATRQKKIVLSPLVPMERPSQIPLSWSQERIWFIDKLQGSTNYHIPSVAKLTGHVNVDIIAAAFKAIVNRHEILRTVYREEEGMAFQEILPENTWQLTHVVPDTGVDEYIAAAISKPFDLAHDFMLRVHLVQLNTQEHVLIMVIHHIASDGWSGAILINELVELYRSIKQDKLPDLPPLPVQYADYALWQRINMDKVIGKKLSYWEKKLKGVEPLLLPTDFKRPLVQSAHGRSIHFIINNELTAGLHELAKQESVTLYVTLLAVFKVLLFRYTGQEDICVGSPVANRSQKETEALIGCFINTIALRSNLTQQQHFRELLLQLKETTLEAYNHQDVPFEKVIDQVVTNRDLSRSSLFQVLFTLDNNEEAGAIDLGDIVLSDVSFTPNTAKFDISVNISEISGELRIEFAYYSDLFLEETILRMADHYRNLLMTVVENRNTAIGRLHMLSVTETRQLTTGFNQSAVEYPKNKTLVHLFEEQVAKTPDHTALFFENEQLTYQHLQEQANQLAHFIRSKGVQENTPVGIYLNHPLNTIVAIWGILKAGAAYVPIDAELPAGKVNYIIEDTGMKLLVTNEALAKGIEQGKVQTVLIDAGLQAIQQQGKENVAANYSSAHAAYIIYTSGTTGKSKGVLITHRNLVDYFYGLFGATGITSNKTFALMSTMAADLGNTVLFGALLSGGTLHLFSRDTLRDADALQAYFNRQVIDCIKIVPSHWNAICAVEQLPVKKTLIFGGEALHMEMIEKIRSVNPAIHIINHYGPTETTIGKLIHHIDPQRHYHEIPIGMPFSNTEVYVLNDHQMLCPVGVAGELFISGDGVSVGYWNKPGLTAAKFIEDPYVKGRRMYGTGDVVRRLADGNIVFLGRKDDQVK